MVMIDIEGAVAAAIAPLIAEIKALREEVADLRAKLEEKPLPSENEIVGTGGITKALGVSKPTVLKLIKSGELEAFPVSCGNGRVTYKTTRGRIEAYKKALANQ